MKKHEEVKKPFFANLLEVQKKEDHNPVYFGVSNPWLDQAQTQKWPSDGDDEIPPIEF
jgi:hypothetical protein